MIRIVSIFAFVLFAAALAFGKPTNPNAAKPAPVAPSEKLIPRPRIMGYVTNYGDCLPNGKDQFTIEGNFWSAVGTIRKDGSIFILWTSLTSGDLYPGVYHVDQIGNLYGIYGNANSAKLEDNGELTGKVYQERIYRIEPELPDI